MFARKMNLKPNLRIKIWHEEFCQADGGATFHMLFLAPNFTLSCKGPPLPLKMFGSTFSSPGQWLLRSANVMFPDFFYESCLESVKRSLGKYI